MSPSCELNTRILVLGYSARLQGGVTKVTGHLLRHMPEMELHPFLYGYTPRLYSIFRTFISFLAYCARLALNPGRYAIIHIIIGSPGDALRTIPYILVAALGRYKICLQYHTSTDIIMQGLPRSFIRTLVLRIWKLVDTQAFLSMSLARLHGDFACQATQTVVVIPNALDRNWHETEILPVTDRNRDIVFFGRWSWEKGVNDLVNALEKVTVPVECECYTNPPNGVHPAHCRLLPWVPESEVLRIMRTARILILPSYAEAYPTVLLEAAACGTPFIATDIAGIPDIVNESGAGVLIKPGDVRGLAAAIDMLMTDEDLWKTLSNNGKKWVSQLNTESIVAKWRNTYRNMLKGKGNSWTAPPP
jgi:glycosyltransferase involved in cell wall biosynthesis